MITAEQFNQRAAPNLPGYLGIVIRHIGPNEVRADLAVRTELMAPNGYLHAATVVALADSSAGCGCIAHLPPGATGFTTVELKCNHVGTAQAGTLDCHATAAHTGKTTQVWDAVVTHRDSGRTIALFRCTQMILYAKPAEAATGR